MRHAALVALLALSGPAIAQHAQPAPPPFVPYTITLEQHNWIMAALGEIPAKHSLTLIQALAQLELKAQQEAADAARKRAEEAKPNQVAP